MDLGRDSDRILAYGCKGIVFSILDDLLKATPKDMSERAYIEMCGKIFKLIAECIVEDR